LIALNSAIIFETGCGLGTFLKNKSSRRPLSSTRPAMLLASRYSFPDASAQQG
jgi:hypothetical protein